MNLEWLACQSLKYLEKADFIKLVIYSFIPNSLNKYVFSLCYILNMSGTVLGTRKKKSSISMSISISISKDHISGIYAIPEVVLGHREMAS